MELLKYDLQHSAARPVTTYLANLVTATERAIDLLGTKVQNSYCILATKKLKQILNSGNHHNFLQKIQLYVIKKQNYELATENAISAVC
jgi:hypothetical protein